MHLPEYVYGRDGKRYPYAERKKPEKKPEEQREETPAEAAASSDR